MSPRKKSKPNPQAPADASSTGRDIPADTSTTPTPASTPGGSELLQNASSNGSVAESTAASTASSTVVAPDEQKLNKKGSRKWLGSGGSWRSKAPAIVKTAKESIGVAGGATAELPGEEGKKPKDESPAKFLTKRKSSKGNAIPASMTKLNVSSDGSINEPPVTKAEAAEDSSDASTLGGDEPPLPPDPPKKSGTDPATSTFGWRSWWSRPDGHPEGAKLKDGSTTEGADDAQRTPLPGPTPSEEPDAKSKELGYGTAQPMSSQDRDTEMEDAPGESLSEQDTEMKDAPSLTSGKSAPNTSSSSWFWLWSSAQNAQTNPPTEPAANKTLPPATDTPAESVPATTSSVQLEAGPEALPTAELSNPATANQKPSAWAFWTRGNPKEQEQPADGVSHKQVGEVAVFNTPSQSRPEAAQFNEQEEQRKEADLKKVPEVAAEDSITKRSLKSLRGRPKAKGTTKDAPADTPSSSKPATPSTTSPAPSPTRLEAAPAAQPAHKQALNAKHGPDNLILPEFRHTYGLVQKPTYWQQIRQYFLGGEAAMPHLHINPAPPRIKKAVAIGVHGYFPAPIFQKVLGQPTGTSIRFANSAATAIKSWTEARGYCPEIEQIALEGEGFVAERVNTLWKLLLNWIEHIKAADFILVACHSQGVPVAIMLVAKLIQFGCVNATRIGICAMAGVNTGPFLEYKTKYLGATAAELFEFSNPKSLVSQMYLAGLDEVLRHGVRVLYVGSIDDQLVSLESSTFSVLSHPYVYRAVFVDGRIHAPDFITHLVGFALKLRNLGLPDHGLIRELSPALAGSLYGGEGHSRVYEDPRVYELAMQHALETTSLPIQPQQRPATSTSFQGINIPIPGAKIDGKDVYKLRVKDYEGVGTGNQNPFFLPWAMRGLLEEEFVKKELGEEVEKLLAMFEDWKPTGKQLKDVKFRLEGVRSKL
ncbi:hypothetical protein BDV95DRAFT_680653 [Massariosphaeria phaeospora]|uniref:YMC020W-like alpha/beta hydrolase domain-containing protein n=1 Tax=Massariosphaeria phaeospora TaxID=100035 RepID=A0A7C8M449_9PLEO|nr:hypothetical protein BDV95DRAFT_680653 [Massariosphaeria phaeospora]